MRTQEQRLVSLGLEVFKEARQCTRDAIDFRQEVLGDNENAKLLVVEIIHGGG